MSKHSSYNNYTAADIERYYGGQMSAKEMHALEKAALDDPFLADALEGYVHTKTPAQDVQDIRNKLFNKEDKGRVVGFRRASFLRIAAVFILIAGLGWATYQIAFLDKKEIAANPANNEKVVTETTIADDTTITNETNAINDFAANNNTTTATTQTNGTDGTTASKTTSVIKETEFNDVLNSRIQGTSVTQPDTSSAVYETSMAAAPTANRSARNSEVKLLSGKVVDENNAPVPFATITNKQNNISVQADNKGNFNLPVKDSVVDVTVNSIGYNSNKAFLRAEQKDVKITLKENSNSLNEVVVSKAPQVKKRENRFTVENAEPAEGWTTFNKYVVDQLEAPEDEELLSVKGEVKLSFDVNEKGEAENIKVEKSLCSKCDEKAIRILKEGTKWLKGKKKKKATAKIKF